jgi:hypothetical protein
MAEAVLTWERTDSYVEEKSAEGTFHARCGIVHIGGHYWEGFERLGRVALDEGTYPGSTAMLHEKKGYALIPKHKQMVPSKKNPGTLQVAELMFHSAGVPSDLDGCVGAGWIYSDRLTESRKTMKEIWQLAGGTPANPVVKLTIIAVGKRTPSMGTSATYLKGLKRYAGL